MRLLVVIFKTLGDICMATSVVHALKQKFPDSTIDFITMPQNKNILDGNPDINKIILMDNYFDANMYFIENAYDEIFRLNMITPFDSMWHHDTKQQNGHLVDFYAKRAGIDNLIDKNVYIYLNQEDIDSVNDYWEDIDINKKYIAIHTTSGAHPGQQPVISKDWPIEKFNELANKLDYAGYNLIQIGAFNDAKIKSKNVIDFTGKFSFKQNAEVIKRCVGYIGVDSGPAYLLNYAKVPAIIIMGATQHIIGGPSVGPFGENLHYINAPKPQNQNCQPVPCYINCVINHNGGRGCIADISVDQVLNKFKEVVQIEKA